MSTTVTITGRLGGDPELRYTAQGKAVASFSLVTSKNTKLPDGSWEESETTWYKVTAWDAFAENVTETLQKGDQVIVVGRLYMETYQDKQTGQERQSIKVNAYGIGPDLKRAAWKRHNLPPVTTPTATKVQDPWATPADDDIPPF